MIKVIVRDDKNSKAEDDLTITVLSLVRWRGGERTVQRLGRTHPHGYWLDWEA